MTMQRRPNPQEGLPRAEGDEPVPGNRRDEAEAATLPMVVFPRNHLVRWPEYEVPHSLRAEQAGIVSDRQPVARLLATTDRGRISLRDLSSESGSPMMTEAGGVRNAPGEGEA